MFKTKKFNKIYFSFLMVGLILCLTYPLKTFAAGEPGNGNYKIKSVATGEYLTISNGQIQLSSNGTVFKIEDTEPSPSVKWFSITNNSKALSFSNRDANASLVDLIPGSLNYGNPNYYPYTCQRFLFGKTRSGYNIHSVAFGNNTDRRVLTVENGNLLLKRANGSRNQIFTVEWQY